MSPAVSLIIPSYQRRESAVRAVTTLSNQILAPEHFEVLVAIDGSSDGTREALESLHMPFALRVLWQANRGRAAACNLGIKAASGQVIVLLDDDMQAAPQLLAAHLAAHSAAQRRGVIGAAPVRLELGDSAAAAHVAQKFNGHLHKLAQPGYHLVLRDFYSGNFSIRRDVLHEIGLFNEAFTRYGNEDLELALRLQQAHVEIRYCAEALAWQRYTKDYAGLARDTIAKGHTAVQFAHMHPQAGKELRLHQPARSFPFQQGRSAIVALSARYPILPETLTSASRLLPTAIRRRWLSAALELCYWSGVQASRAVGSRE